MARATRVIDEMSRFLVDRYHEGVERARLSGNALITHGAAQLGISLEVAERGARLDLHAAETRLTFFEDTVRPYLGTAGPTGRIAEQQLRILAWAYVGHRRYKKEWLPEDA